MEVCYVEVCTTDGKMFTAMDKHFLMRAHVSIVVV